MVYVGGGISLTALYATTGAYLWSFFPDWPIFSPAINNAVVYASGFALNARTGTELWTYPNGAVEFGCESSPAVANGVLYNAAGNESDGSLYAVNATTGAVLWSFPIGRCGSSSPAVADGMVYIGSVDGRLYAFGL